MRSEEFKNYMESQKNHSLGTTSERWITLALCAAVMVAGTLEQFLHNRPAYAGTSAPNWPPFIAAMIAAAGIVRLKDLTHWIHIQAVLRWSGLFLLVWVANGLPLDLLRLTPLIPLAIDWPGFVTKIFALAAAIMIVRFALARPTGMETARPVIWYAYAAFLLALPYPVLRTLWALGGSIGLTQPGAAGQGFIPWLASIPWLLAAALSLLLISPRRRLSRRFLVASGWFATAMVALIGPAAFWSLVTKLVTGEDIDIEVGIKIWVPCLIYGSWLLWAIAAGAATRSYQLRSAGSVQVLY